MYQVINYHLSNVPIAAQVCITRRDKNDTMEKNERYWGYLERVVAQRLSASEAESARARATLASTEFPRSIQPSLLEENINERYQAREAVYFRLSLALEVQASSHGRTICHECWDVERGGLFIAARTTRCYI